MDDWECMRRYRRLSKVSRPNLEITGGIPHLSVDMVECERNDIASRVELNLGKGGEGKVGWGA